MNMIDAQLKRRVQKLKGQNGPVSLLEDDGGGSTSVISPIGKDQSIPERKLSPVRVTEELWEVHGGQHTSGRFPKKLLMIATYPPQECGIATFTRDLRCAMESHTNCSVDIMAVAPEPATFSFPDEVVYIIERNNSGSYAEAARFINSSDYDAICLQHEFGLFGGQEGIYIVDMLRSVQKPVVSTLHTILSNPDGAYLTRTREVIDVSDLVVTLTPHGRTILKGLYDCPMTRSIVIPHGIPERPYVTSDEAKKKFGWENRSVILTFGLIGPSKGIESMLDALPQIVADHPDVLYVIAGRTHPVIVRNEGEEYRNRLCSKVQELNLEDNVQFVNRYLDDDDLQDYLQACDIYVTPYQNRDQISSGTLSLAFGTGRAIVSTPYWYAVDLIGNSRGKLVEFGSASSMARAINQFLDDEPSRIETGKRAYEHSRAMTWRNVASRYEQLFGMLTSRVPSISISADVRGTGSASVRAY